MDLSKVGSRYFLPGMELIAWPVGNLPMIHLLFPSIFGSRMLGLAQRRNHQGNVAIKRSRDSCLGLACGQSRDCLVFMDQSLVLLLFDSAVSKKFHGGIGLIPSCFSCSSSKCENQADLDFVTASKTLSRQMAHNSHFSCFSYV